MGFLNLVKEHDAVGLPADCFRQLAPFLIAHISGRRPDQPGYGIFLHILAHINPHHIILVIKQRCRQGFGQFRLTHAGRPQEQK